eukprot:jgi/Tetstr1/457853/TSEL_004255.t1
MEKSSPPISRCPEETWPSIEVFFGHAGAATSTFFCFISDMPSLYMHLTSPDYERKGMTKPITKSTWYAAMMAHAMGKAEVKVQSGKGKAITKADLPALSGPEVKKMLEGRQVVLDAMIHASHAD